MADFSLVGVTEIVPESTIPGTQAWLQAVTKNAKAYARFAEKDVRPLVKEYRALCEHEVWETWFPDDPHTQERFCREVLGYPREFLDEMTQGVDVLDSQGFMGPISLAQVQQFRRKALAAADEISLPQRGGDRRSIEFQSSNTTLKADRDESYLRRRLKRDKPEIYKKLLSGKIKNVSEAARLAGWRKKYNSVRMDDPDAAADTIKKFMTDPEALARLAELLLQ